MARMTLEEIRNRASTVDRAKVEATTEAEIEAHRAADGDADLDVTAGARTVESPRSLRVRLGMTQPEMAAALSIPLGTWRNWEQGRVTLEPAAAALLRVVSHNPAVALAALAAGDARPDAPTNAEREVRGAPRKANADVWPSSSEAKQEALRQIESAFVLGDPPPVRHG